MSAYEPQIIEPKWQGYWRMHESFRTLDAADLPKYYVLDMIPYPSGAGLHVGHVEGYTASDVTARFMRMRGYDVLHPMGWDAFGLPAEQYAIEVGVHPADSTATNITTFKRQCDLMGLSFDWRREINTASPEYYRWTQWIFLRMLERDLAYRAEAQVNWCPALGTVLANDEVIDGKSERGGHPVVRRMMWQWMLRITAYAERLLEGLDRVDYPESIKMMQRDRIGRSEGADATFAILDCPEPLEIFTTRPDTMFGATFCVLAPEHPLVNRVTTPKQQAAVNDYVAKTASRSELERLGSDAAKTGVFTGAYAINPFTNQRIPIWVADYVLITYGTGAIMCVPGHDSRDWAFARLFGLPIVEVITGGNVETAPWEGAGTLVNSGFLNGLDQQTAVGRAIDELEKRGLGKRKVRYRMRDWIFARQRYWGEPVPVVYADGVTHALPDEALPLVLPRLENFKPSSDEDAPLARLKDWVRTTLPGTDRPATRETHTMPTLAGSSWYFFRYIDPANSTAVCDFNLAKEWMPVDLYIGGAEHAVGHLLYSRFFTKFLYDLGLVPVDEPYKRLVNQGMILGEDRRKMSKRYGNVINPTDVVRSYGADSLRMYELFMGPIEADKPWSTAGIEGIRRFLDRTWRVFFDNEGHMYPELESDAPLTADINRLLHATIDKVFRDTEGLRFNTAISQMMVFVNEMTRQSIRPRRAMEPFVLLLAPYAPHLAEELWQCLGHTESLAREPFPVPDPAWLVQDRIEIAVQVNGKVCARVCVGADDNEAEVFAASLAHPKVTARIAGAAIERKIYVPKRMVSLTVRKPA